MALFSFGKKKQGEGFEFSINDTYTVNNSSSAVVTGTLHRAALRPEPWLSAWIGREIPYSDAGLKGLSRGRRWSRSPQRIPRGTMGPITE